MTICPYLWKRANAVNTVVLFCCFFIPTPGWASVFIRWTTVPLPPQQELGFKDIVVPLNEGGASLLDAAAKQGYRVYVEASLQQAKAAAERAAKDHSVGLLLALTQAERDAGQTTLAALRSSYPNLRILVLTSDGKQPEMRGSLVIKRDAVLEVSSPTAQPWIDSNLSLVRIEQTAFQEQDLLYSFSWNTSDKGEDPKGLPAPDYLLAVAEAGAFHANLLLKVDEDLQKNLSRRDPSASKLWNQVRLYANFYSAGQEKREPAANVAIVVDDLDPGDEVMNLLARHNIPFRVFRPRDVKGPELQAFDVVAVFAKPDERSADQLEALADRGKTIVLVDSHGSYPWQKAQPVPLNEHTMSYQVGSGKVLQLSEPVSDPETFAQDIRRLIGKQNALISLWNGLTTIAVPYSDKGKLQVVEFINYAQEPVRLQVQLKGSFNSVRYESPQTGCCQSLSPTHHDGFTEFVIPDLAIAGRVQLEQ